MKVILRVLVSPFILFCLLITYNYSAIKHLIQFLRMGGEISIYEENEVPTIEKIYKEIKKQRTI